MTATGRPGVAGTRRARTVMIGAIALPLLASSLLVGCTDNAAGPDPDPATSSADATEPNPDSSNGGTAQTPAAPPVTATIDGAAMEAYAAHSGGVNVLAVNLEDAPEDDGEGPDPVYEEPQRTLRAELLEAQKQAGDYTPDDPLLVMNPFGTQAAGLYVHFTAESEGELSFTVSAPASEDFTRIAQDHDPSATGVEAQVVGLVPGARNELTLTWTPTAGDPVERTVEIDAPEPEDTYMSQLGRSVEGDEAQLSDGLLALAGVRERGNAVHLYDNAGTMRGSIPTGDYQADNVRPADGEMVYSVGNSAVARVDGLGRVQDLYDLGDYIMHHDLTVQDGIAYVLVSDTGPETAEDKVLRLDLETGDVTELVDLADILPGYDEMTHPRADADVKDWVHINSIDVHGDAMYLSSRETSTVIALNNIDRGPALDYLLGHAPLWEGSGHEGAHLAPVGDPKVIGGQHTVRRQDDPSLPDGQYYLEMFDNNYWDIGTRDDYTGPGPEGTSTDREFGEASYVLRYLVDENAGTYEEALRYPVPYSSIVSSVQRMGGPDGNIVVNSGMASTVQELTPAGELIAEYRYDSDSHAYRAYKDTFEGFWYAGS